MLSIDLRILRLRTEKKMKRSYSIKMPIAAIAVSIGVFFMMQAGCEQKKDLESVTIALSRQPISAPVYAAHDKKFFEGEGLRVTLRQYWTGKDALDAVIKGKADFCTVAETPVMFAAFKNEPIAVIATIADTDRFMKIIARKDRNILGPRDLEGKTIGVSMGTNAQYFFDAYLSFNGISRDRVHPVPMQPELMADALVKGKIDAAVCWEPHIARLRKKLGSNAVVFENEEIYQTLWNIVARREYVKNHRETVKKLLRGLLQAEDFIAEHQQEAQRITAGYVGDPEFSLNDFNFDLRLGQSLVLDLEEQARWAINSGLTDKKEVPNFLDLLYFQGMETVAPDSVTVVHK
jgi:ABC-type nitrate/sulfonate/bicarbonate transport system substrate-binding protein